MKLYDHLQRAKSEEDVKDIYIRELDLNKYRKGLVDIQTKDVWFEAKTGGNVSCYAMFTQLLNYVHVAKKKGEHIPALLAVVDQQKAALMNTDDVLPFLKKETVKWGKSASKFTQEALNEVSKYIGTYFVEYNLETQSDEFVKAFKYAKKHKKFLRTQITPDNLKPVFDKWMEAVGSGITDIKDESDYSLLFFADVMSDGEISTHDKLPAELIHKDGKPAFLLEGKLHKLGNADGYRQFWLRYDRPPEAEHRNYLLERRDSLIPLEKRMFEGAFYTPLILVDKAYDTLTKTLGANWQQKYIIWDMSCGVGNLEVKHSNHRKIFMSTLDVADVKTMQSTRTCAAAQRFQYDYLNDDITDDGEIDYSLTNKVPKELRDAIAKGKKILVLMNPPYAESANPIGRDNTDNKTGVADTRVATTMEQTGYASRELYTQFLARIAKEIPTATIAMFSTLKYVNAPNFEKFRDVWHAKYKGGFIVDSQAFDGLNGDFPIGFLIWDTDPKVHKNKPLGDITAEIIDKSAKPIGMKTFRPLPKSSLINRWIKRPKPNGVDAMPISNALSPTTRTKDVRGLKWADGAIGGMIFRGSDFQSASAIAIFSSGYNSAGGLYITKENLAEVAMAFTMRRIIKPTWINDRDQFLIPTGELTEEFKNDCLIWMLFSKFNLTAGADGLEWNDKKWSLVNHFIPFSEREVNAPARFESDFMVQYLAGKKLSAESKSVMAEGRKLWKAFFAEKNSPDIRDTYKINRPDAGWYQIRNFLKEHNKKIDTGRVRFTDFCESYEILSDKLRPMVFDLGFLLPNN